MTAKQVDAVSLAASSASDTVTVCLKQPWDLFLHVDELFEVQENVPGGGTPRTVKIARAVDPARLGVRPELIEQGKFVRVNGWNHRWRLEHGEIQQGLPSCPGVYGLTHGVSREFWETWVKGHSDMALVTGSLLFAAPSAPDANAMTREREGLRSGLEPIDPDKPPRVGLKEVARYDGQPA